MKLLTSRSLVQNQVSRESKFLTKEATEVCLNGWKARYSFSQKSVPAGQLGPRGKAVVPGDTQGGRETSVGALVLLAPFCPRTCFSTLRSGHTPAVGS